jgi:hypothetical protein
MRAGSRACVHYDGMLTRFDVNGIESPWGRPQIASTITSELRIAQLIRLRVRFLCRVNRKSAQHIEALTVKTTKSPLLHLTILGIITSSCRAAAAPFLSLSFCRLIIATTTAVVSPIRDSQHRFMPRHDGRRRSASPLRAGCQRHSQSTLAALPTAAHWVPGRCCLCQRRHTTACLLYTGTYSYFHCRCLISPMPRSLDFIH